MNTPLWFTLADTIEATQDKANRYSRVDAAKIKMRAALEILMEAAEDEYSGDDIPSIYGWLENFHFELGEKLS